MASSAFLKLLCVGLMGLLVLSPHAKALIGCDVVYSHLSSCIGYVTGGSMNPGCCSGVQSLYSMANNTPNRQSVCACLKKLAATYRNYIGRAKTLPSMCHVSIGYAIDPSVDCSKVV